jgi:hypothetical protein
MVFPDEEENAEPNAAKRGRGDRSTTEATTPTGSLNPIDLAAENAEHDAPIQQHSAHEMRRSFSYESEDEEDQRQRARTALQDTEEGGGEDHRTPRHKVPRSAYSSNVCISYYFFLELLFDFV